MKRKIFLKLKDKILSLDNISPLIDGIVSTNYMPPPFWRKPYNPDGWEGIDPIVLNLSRDEVSKPMYSNVAHFDYDGDGFAEETEWIGQNQGLLVMDHNENGIIDDGSELFGNQTILSNGRQAVDGYQALAELDDNKDGIIDASDTSWSKLLVWADNGDDIIRIAS